MLCHKKCENSTWRVKRARRQVAQGRERIQREKNKSSRGLASVRRHCRAQDTGFRLLAVKWATRELAFVVKVEALKIGMKKKRKIRFHFTP